MIYNHNGKAFSFHQISPNQPNLQATDSQKTQNKSQLIKKQYTNNVGDNINLKINGSAEFLKHRTLNLVETLRKYSLPKNLELQIETYLTDVLDQMDILQNLNNHKVNDSNKKSSFPEASAFKQLQKPQGDPEDSYLEETLRQLPIQINMNDTKERNQTLHKKIQNILQSFQQAELFDVPEKTKDQKYLSQIEQKSERNESSNQSRISRGAHRFSKMYIRDFQKPKKNKIL